MPELGVWGSAAARRALPLVLLLALLLRLLVVAVDGSHAPTIDAGDYDRHARSIAAGDGFPDTLIAAEGTPTALRPPAWPYVLGAVYALTGDSVLAARLLGVLLGTLTVALVFLVAARLWDRRVAIVAAAATAVWPSLALLSNSIMSENLFLPTVLGLLLTVLVIRERPAPPPALLVLAGVLCGVATLTRVVGVLTLIPVALALWGSPRLSWRSVRGPLLVAIVAALTILPWTVRNTVAFDRFVPLATQEGFNLYGTYNPVSERSTDFPAGWRFPPSLPAARGLFDRPGIDEAEISERLGREGRTFLFDHPLYPFRVAYWNTRRMLNLAEGGEAKRLDYQQTAVPRRLIEPVEAGVAIMAILAAAGLAALVVLRRRWLRPAWVWLFPAVLYAGVAFFLAVPRYRLPLDPFLLMLASAGAVAAVDAARRR